jgi:hypothetical protein
VGAAGLLVAAGAGTSHAATNAIPGLVLHFNMDEVKSDAFLDLVTSNALGRAVNARTSSNGKLASACEFSPKSSYVEVDDAARLNPKRLTVALWFRSSKEAWITRHLLDKGQEKGYALSIVGGGKEKAGRGKLRAVVNGKGVLSDEVVNNDVWHHAAVIYDGQAVKLYVDGVQQKQTESLSGDLPASPAKLTLGMNRSSASSQDKEQAFDGLIDEVMVFNRALDPQDLKRVLSLVKPKFSKWQVERRLKELKELYDRGLLLKEFYDRKVEECEVVE